MFALAVAAAWFGVWAVLGAVDWWRWRAPLDAKYVYGPTFDERTEGLHGMYLPILVAIEDLTPIDAVVIVVLPEEPATQIDVFFDRYTKLLGAFVLPRRILISPPDTWRELQSRVAPGTPMFVLDVLGLVAPAAELSELSRSAVHSLWRIEAHG